MKLGDEDKKLFAAISKLNKRQLTLINDFDVRIGTLLDHKTMLRSLSSAIRTIIELATSLKEQYEKTTYDKLQKNIKVTLTVIHGLEHHILKKFNNLFVDEEERKELKWTLAEEEKDLLLSERVKLHDFNELKRLSESKEIEKAEAANKRLKKVMSDIQNAIKFEEYIQTADKHFLHLLSRLDQVILDQKEVIKKELGILRQLDTIFVNDYKKIMMKVIVLRPLANDLLENNKELTHLLTQEKETVIQPFNKFLEDKRTAYHKMDELFEHRMGSLYDKVKHYMRGTQKDGSRIRKQDIKEDVKHFLGAYDEEAYQLSDSDLKRHVATFSSSSEFREYVDKLEEINRIFKHSLLTERAERFLNHLKMLARRGSVKSETKAKSALFDSLTLLKNRRAFNDELGKAISVADRDIKDKFALAIIDIDNFKGINEVYGHATGDQVLISFSELLQKYIRKADTVFRWGGEEFAIILRNVDEALAFKIVDKLRLRVSNMEHGPFPKTTDKKSVREEWVSEGKLNILRTTRRADVVRITSSAGIAAYPKDYLLASVLGNNPSEALLKAADKAENYSKDHGKNRVTSFSVLAN